MKRKLIALTLAVAMVVTTIAFVPAAAEAKGALSVSPTAAGAPNELSINVSNSGSADINFTVFNTANDSLATGTVGAGATKKVTFAGSTSFVVTVKDDADPTINYASCSTLAAHTANIVYKLDDGEGNTATVTVGHTTVYKDKPTVVDSDLTYTHNGKTYTRKGTIASKSVNYGNTEVEFEYEIKIAKPYTVSVNYFDAQGTSIGGDSFSATPDGDNGDGISRFNIPASLTPGGVEYIRRGTLNEIAHDYSSSTRSYSVTYDRKVQNDGKPYTVTVKYVDENGDFITQVYRTVEPDKSVTIPNQAKLVYGNQEYDLKAGEPASITHKYEDKAKTPYTVVYVKGTLHDAKTITFNFMSNGTKIGSDTRTVSYGRSVVYQKVSEVFYKGVGYKLAAGEAATLTHSYNDAAASYDIEYVQDPNLIAQAYTVTVRYISVTEPKELKSYTVTVKEGDVADISAPTSYTDGTTNYVFLSGQSAKYDHDYNNNRNKLFYTFYYKDENDNSVYIPAPPPDDDDDTDTELPPDGTRYFGPDGEPILENPDGSVTIGTTTLPVTPPAELEPPLVPNVPTDTPNSEYTNIWLIAGGSVLLAAGALTGLFLILKKKKQGQN